MSIVFPGACLYARHGFCLRAELLNPGLEEKLRCVRLAGLMRDWDDFLDRAERFSLSEKEAADIWNKRRHSALESRAMCAHNRPLLAGEGAADIDCAYLFRTACLLTMPRCEEGCAWFVRARARS